jgi:DNA replication and repair protein RecF
LVVRNLQINGFRNLNKFAVSFGAKKNLIYGANGSGKTSVIEALYLLGFGKSFLPASKQEMVNFHSPGFHISAIVQNGSGENSISAGFDTGFRLRVNNAKNTPARIGEILYPVFFSSLNFNMTVEHNPLFRKMIDRFIFGVHALYLHQVLRYNHLVKQKSFLLKTLGKPINISELGSWNKLLSATGFEIIKKRMDFVNQLNDEIVRGFCPELEIIYRPSRLSDGEMSESSFFNDLESARKSEIAGKRCLIGPQRDHYEVLVGGKKLPLFSSGEKKKYMILIHLAFVNLYRRMNEQFPVFLFDDFDVAMDARNLGFIIDRFPSMQIIATAVARNDKFENVFELGKEN